jgi:hypothetical protein
MCHRTRDETDTGPAVPWARVPSRLPAAVRLSHPPPDTHRRSGPRRPQPNAPLQRQLPVRCADPRRPSVGPRGRIPICQRDLAAVRSQGFAGTDASINRESPTSIRPHLFLWPPRIGERKEESRHRQTRRRRSKRKSSVDTPSNRIGPDRVHPIPISESHSDLHSPPIA